MSKEKTECSHILQKNGDICQFKHLHQIHLKVMSWLMTHPAQVILTHMETLLPMSVGMSMHRFSSSPGRSNAMLYMFLVIVHYNHHQSDQEQSPLMFCVIAELPSVKSSETWLTVDDEAGVESNNLVHGLILLLRLLMFMLMLFRTMKDGVGLDDYYNNIVVDCWCCLGRWRMVSVLMIITSPVMTERVRKRPEAAPGMRLGWTWVFQGFPSNAYLNMEY